MKKKRVVLVSVAHGTTQKTGAAVTLCRGNGLAKLSAVTLDLLADGMKNAPPLSIVAGEEARTKRERRERGERGQRETERRNREAETERTPAAFRSHQCARDG